MSKDEDTVDARTVEDTVDTDKPVKPGLMTRQEMEKWGRLSDWEWRLKDAKWRRDHPNWHHTAELHFDPRTNDVYMYHGDERDDRPYRDIVQLAIANRPGTESFLAKQGVPCQTCKRVTSDNTRFYCYECDPSRVCQVCGVRSNWANRYCKEHCPK